MKKLWLGLLAGLLLVIYQPVWGQAASYSAGSTETQISFYAGPTTETSAEGDQINEGIADGTGAYQMTAQPATITGSLQRVLATGRLPQTGENVKLYQQIFGGMLLLATLLALGVYQVRRENKTIVD